MFASTPPPAAIKATQQLSAFGLPYSPVRSIQYDPKAGKRSNAATTPTNPVSAANISYILSVYLYWSNTLV